MIFGVIAEPPRNITRIYVKSRRELHYHTVRAKAFCIHLINPIKRRLTEHKKNRLQETIQLLQTSFYKSNWIAPSQHQPTMNTAATMESVIREIAPSTVDDIVCSYMAQVLREWTPLEDDSDDDDDQVFL